jgi:hypothetical protein
LGIALKSPTSVHRLHRNPTKCVPGLARPDQFYLAKDKHLAASSIIVAVSAMRFFYTVTFKIASTPREAASSED